MDATRTRVKVADISNVYRRREGKRRVSGVTVVPALGQPRERTVTVLAGIGNSAPFSCHNADLLALEKAVVERIMCVKRPKAPEEERVLSVNDVWEGFALPPAPDKGFFRSSTRNYINQLKSKLTNHVPVSVEAFVSYYNGQKRTIYETAGAAYERGELRRSHSYVSAFVKDEKSEKNGVPRVIQPRNPIYNVAVGRYLKPVEHEIYDAIDRVWGQNIVMKGKNADQVGRQLWSHWLTLKDPCAIFLDVSRFDQHVHTDALGVEHSVYLNMYENDPELRKLLSWQLETKGFGRLPDGDVRYFVRGKRMSGDMNTAVGNIILMTAMVWSFFKQYRNAAGERVKHTGGNNGDDHVLMVERCEAARIMEVMPAWFLRMGFTLVVEGSTTLFEEIEFCRSHPVLVDGEYRMVRGVVDTLSKDLVTTQPVQNSKAWLRRRRAIGECGLALTSGVPVFQEFYSCLLRGTEAVEAVGSQPVTGMVMLAKGMMARHHEPTDDCRVSFWKAYGIDPHHQTLLEEVWRNTDCVWRPPVVLPMDERPPPLVYI